MAPGISSQVEHCPQSLTCGIDRFSRCFTCEFTVVDKDAIALTLDSCVLNSPHPYPQGGDLAGTRAGKRIQNSSPTDYKLMLCTSCTSTNPYVCRDCWSPSSRERGSPGISSILGGFLRPLSAAVAVAPHKAVQPLYAPFCGPRS